MFRCSADISHCEIILNSLPKAIGLLKDIERANNLATYSLYKNKDNEIDHFTV